VLSTERVNAVSAPVALTGPQKAQFIFERLDGRVFATFVPDRKERL
jgi:hypothetical protein